MVQWQPRGGPVGPGRNQPERLEPMELARFQAGRKGAGKRFRGSIHDEVGFATIRILVTAEWTG